MDGLDFCRVREDSLDYRRVRVDRHDYCRVRVDTGQAGLLQGQGRQALQGQRRVYILKLETSKHSKLKINRA